ncbi:hypothetical protein SAMN03080617_04368, partial [Algoriphagus alkaliphilus]
DLRGLEKVNGEFALIMTVYNLKRTITLLGIEELTEKIKKWKPDYKKAALALKSSLKAQITKYLTYFGISTTAVKLNTVLNRIQFSNHSNHLYGSEMDFFGKSRGFFTV